MLFSGLFFLLFFLPVFLLVYHLCPGIHQKNTVLLFFSLVFYAFGGIRYLLLLLIMSFLGFLSGIFIENTSAAPKKRHLLFVSLAFFLSVLGFFKYTGFFLGNLGVLFHVSISWVNFALPLGISFYTFKLISYVCDVYHARVAAERHFSVFLLYICIFHQSLEGPIIRYKDMRPYLYDRKFNILTFSSGIYRFAIGLAKKTILADHCKTLADTLLPISGSLSGIPTAGIWMGSLFYTLQIYLDFSAYSDMAIALGEMIGFHYAENFRFPYLATSIKDFWTRWHISLSSFFKDYVYIPLGGNRKGSFFTFLNLLIVWSLTGLWHGASWNFIFWGLYYCLFVLLENFMKKMSLSFSPFFSHIYTLFVVNFGWILFRFSNFPLLKEAVHGFFGGHASFTNTTVSLTLANNFAFLLLAVLCCTPVFSCLRQKLSCFLAVRQKNRDIVYGGRLFFTILLFLLSLAALAKNTYQPFLYNQF